MRHIIVYYIYQYAYNGAWSGYTQEDVTSRVDCRSKLCVMTIELLCVATSFVCSSMKCTYLSGRYCLDINLFIDYMWVSGPWMYCGSICDMVMIRDGLCIRTDMCDR